jgi:hypothetical protein
MSPSSFDFEAARSKRLRAIEKQAEPLCNVRAVAPEVQAKVLAAWRHDVSEQRWTTTNRPKKRTLFMKIVILRVEGLSVTKTAEQLNLPKVIVAQTDYDLRQVTGVPVLQLRKMARERGITDIAAFVRAEIRAGKAWAGSLTNGG